MWEFPSVEMVSTFDEGERGLEELVKDLGFELALQPVLVKEITHIFSHRKMVYESIPRRFDVRRRC